MKGREVGKEKYLMLVGDEVGEGGHGSSNTYF